MHRLDRSVPHAEGRENSTQPRDDGVAFGRMRNGFVADREGRNWEAVLRTRGGSSRCCPHGADSRFRCAMEFGMSDADRFRHCEFAQTAVLEAGMRESRLRIVSYGARLGANVAVFWSEVPGIRDWGRIRGSRADEDFRGASSIGVEV